MYLGSTSGLTQVNVLGEIVRPSKQSSLLWYWSSKVCDQFRSICANGVPVEGTVKVLLIVLLAASAVAFVATIASPQQQQGKYPWQHSGTNCNDTMTFCWYGVEDVSNPEVTAHGNRLTTQDKDEKPFEWVTAVRCLKDSKLCILARNQKIMNGSQTNIDLYRIDAWSSYEIRAVGENDFPHGKECEIDTLVLNRVEGSVSMLSTPGPAAATKICAGPLGTIKPKTVVYKLEIGPPKS